MRYLIYTSPAKGHLYPIIPTALELVRRGHDVRVMTLESELPTLRALGIQAVAIHPEIEGRPLDDWKAPNPMQAQQRTLKTFLDRARPEMADLTKAMADYSPDGLLIDINAWGAAIAAEASKLPWALFSPYFLPLPSRDVPPFGPGLTPAKGLLGRVRDRLLARLFGKMVNQFLPDLNQLRAQHGLVPLSNLMDALRQAPRLLYYTDEAFDYARSDWPPSIRFVGPGLWEPHAEAEKWVDDIDRPLIVVTLSTEFQNDAKLIETALEAFSGEAVQVVATSAALDPERFVAPENARVERFVPHSILLPKAACVICHGGMGITQKALSAGVPLCIVPFGRDQLEVARRVEAAKAGSRLAPAQLTPERLKLAVQQAMENQRGAERLASLFAERGGPRKAADELEALVGAANAFPA